ncbi:MAG: hypothetical protein HZC41_03060 [Chloroflexi bacterium]|nr:hypothetical protein [Chloroflexota bacterium]
MLFRSEAEISEWCRQTGEQRGEFLTLAKTWQLAQAWYSNRLKPEFRGRTPQEAEQIFDRLGLSSPFWRF